MPKAKKRDYKFKLSEIADSICQFTKDGKRKKNRDVVTWFRWLEKYCGNDESFIFVYRLDKQGRPNAAKG